LISVYEPATKVGEEKNKVQTIFRKKPQQQSAAI
jgi:hypothetical protein